MIRFACKLTRPGFVFDAAFDGDEGVTALFGPSGCGKSTAIRLLAGLERAEAGLIAIGGETLLDTSAGINLPPHRRRIGLVFQDAHLFPHLSVQSNLTYGRWFTPEHERRITFEPVVDVLGIGGLLDRRPSTLSGGERQRVAIGRALLASPRLLLMDEPLASLDAARKREIIPFIERLRDEFRIPIVYVSHAVDEVARLADHVVRLADGKVTVAGPPGAVLGGEAEDRFAVVSVLSGKVAARLSAHALTRLSHPAGDIFVPGDVGPDGASVRVTVRATDVALAIGKPGEVSVRTSLSGEIVAIRTDAGPFAGITVALDGGESLQASVTRLAVDELGLGEGDRVVALVKAAAIT